MIYDILDVVNILFIIYIFLKLKFLYACIKIIIQ